MKNNRKAMGITALALNRIFRLGSLFSIAIHQNTNIDNFFNNKYKI